MSLRIRLVDAVTGAVSWLKGFNGAALVSLVNPDGAIIGSGSWAVVDDVVLESESAQVSFTDLDGDDAYMFRVTGHFVISSASGGAPFIRVNGSSDAGSYAWTHARLAATGFVGDADGAAGERTQMPIINGSSMLQNHYGIVTIDIMAQASALHVMSCKFMGIITDGTVRRETQMTTGDWTAPSGTPAITSILLDAGTLGLGRFAAGSRFQLSKLGPVVP